MSSNTYSNSTESEEELLLTDKLERRGKYANRRNQKYSRKGNLIFVDHHL